MVSSSLRPRSADAAWQAIFLLGLVAGGAVLSWLDPAGLPIGTVVPTELMVGAGLLVGFAARIAAEVFLRRRRLALVTNSEVP